MYDVYKSLTRHPDHWHSSSLMKISVLLAFAARDKACSFQNNMVAAVIAMAWTVLILSSEGDGDHEGIIVAN